MGRFFGRCSHHLTLDLALQDAMFHSVKGPFGVKLDFCDNARVENMTVLDVINTSPATDNMCDSKWWLYKDLDYVGPMSKDYTGANAAGVVVSKAFRTHLRQSFIGNIRSVHGKTVGVDLIGDEVGRAQFFKASKPYVGMDNVEIGGELQAARPTWVTPLLFDKQVETQS